jgi:hypothetical protein
VLTQGRQGKRLLPAQHQAGQQDLRRDWWQGSLLDEESCTSCTSSCTSTSSKGQQQQRPRLRGQELGPVWRRGVQRLHQVRRRLPLQGPQLELAPVRRQLSAQRHHHHSAAAAPTSNITHRAHGASHTSQHTQQDFEAVEHSSNNQQPLTRCYHTGQSGARAGDTSLSWSVYSSQL